MYLQNLLRAVGNSEKKPNDLVPEKLHFRAYYGQPRNPEIWFLLYDLAHYYKMRPMNLIRYLITKEHTRIFNHVDNSQSSEIQK